MESTIRTIVVTAALGILAAASFKFGTFVRDEYTFYKFVKEYQCEIKWNHGVQVIQGLPQPDGSIYFFPRFAQSYTCFNPDTGFPFVAVR